MVTVPLPSKTNKNGRHYEKITCIISIIRGSSGLRTGDRGEGYQKLIGDLQLYRTASAMESRTPMEQ